MMVTCVCVCLCQILNPQRKFVRQEMVMEAVSLRDTERHCIAPAGFF